MRFNRLWIILTLFMVGFLIQAYDVNAGCCVDYFGETCTDYQTSGECLIGQYFPSNTCSQIFPQHCTDGCCCLTGGGQLAWNLSCQNSGGTFYSYPTTLNECNTFCRGAPLPSHRLWGFVKNDTDLVPDVVVTLVDRNNLATQTSNASSTVGYYNFPSVEAGPSLTIFAQKGDCSAEVSITPFNQITQQNITLDCCQYECEFGACINGFRNRTCYAIEPTLCAIDEYTEQNLACAATELCEWDCTEWDPPFSDPNNPDESCPAGYSQRERTCEPIIVGNCEVGTTPNLIMECGITQPTCGNGIIEGAEQCDFLVGPPYTGNSNCPTGRNTREWCDLSTCECIIPTPPTDCNVADPVYPLTVDPKAVYSQRKINVTWGLVGDCADYVDNYKVFGCMNTSGYCSFNNVSGPLSKNVDYYMVLNTTWFELFSRRDYCFKLETTFNNSIIGNKKFNSSSSCMTMGDDVCLAPHDDLWCGMVGGSQAILSCNENNFIQSTTCQSGQYCGVENGVPQCITLSECERCNGLFGIFGYQGFQILNPTLGDIDCPTLTNRVATKTNSNDPTGCFLDYSNTSIDKVYNCSGVNSCYDYKSRLSCEQDYCVKFGINVYDNKCEWEDYSEVFNKGVCRPKKEYVDQGLAIQDCSLCHSPFYNRIYGNCTADTCGLYGNCYFKKSANNGNGQCIDGNSVSCSDYDNAQDCTGGVNVLTDTRWNAQGTTKIAGTNKILFNSSDFLGISRCEWNGTRCYRNADNLSNKPNNVGVDCRMNDAYNRSLCERDVTAPVTLVNPQPYYGEIMDLKGAISTSDYWSLSDNVSDSQAQNRKHTWIYYSIDDGFEYPNKILRVTSPIDEQNLIVNIINEIPDGLEETGQQLYFFYFAEDAARNLETVKNFSFILDLDPPAVVLTTRIESYQGTFDWGEWASNFFVNITLNGEISMPVECAYNLTPIFNYSNYWLNSHSASNIPSTAPPYNYVIDTVPGGLATTYFELWPDRYYYEFRCTDAVGNYRRQNGTFTLDGDLTINNPFPVDTTYTSVGLPHNISIHTTADGVCRYSRITTNYDDMEGTYAKRTLATGDYLHYAPMTEVFVNELEEGGIPSRVYKIYTACDLIINGQHVIKSGGVPDIIRFAVDDLPPITRLLYDPDPSGYGDLENFTNNQSREVLHLYLHNDDSAPMLIDGEFDMSFKARETHYCITTRLGLCEYKEFNLTENLPIILDYNSTEPGNDNAKYGPYPEFCYYSIDNGMNQEQEKCIILRVRNMLFQEPNINIIEIQ